MSKKALCINAAAFLNGEHTVERLLNQPAYLVDRAICDNPEKIDIQNLQLLPYISLGNNKGQLLSYQRGSGGGEKRLAGKFSIGWGGHIEEEPSQTKTLTDIIVDCACREVFEEAGIVLSRERVKEVFLSDAFFLHEENNDTNRVHLGISLFINIQDSPVGKLEEGHIEKAKWVNRSDVYNLELETWSDMVVEKYF